MGITTRKTGLLIEITQHHDSTPNESIQLTYKEAEQLISDLLQILNPNTDDYGMCNREDWNNHPCGDEPPIEHFGCGCGISVYAICPDPSVKLKHNPPHPPRKYK